MPLRTGVASHKTTGLDKRLDKAQDKCRAGPWFFRFVQVESPACGWKRCCRDSGSAWLGLVCGQGAGWQLPRAASCGHRFPVTHRTSLCFQLKQKQSHLQVLSYLKQRIVSSHSSRHRVEKCYFFSLIIPHMEQIISADLNDPRPFTQLFTFITFPF